MKDSAGRQLRFSLFPRGKAALHLSQHRAVGQREWIPALTTGFCVNTSVFSGAVDPNPTIAREAHGSVAAIGSRGNTTEPGVTSEKCQETGLCDPSRLCGVILFPGFGVGRSARTWSLHRRAGRDRKEVQRDRALRPFTPLRCNLVSRIRRWAERTHSELTPQSRESPQRNAKRSASAALPASAVQSSFPDLNLDRAHALGVGTAEPGGAAERFSETGLCGPSRLCGVKNTRPIWMVTLGHPYRRENTGGNSVDFCSYPFVVRLSVFLFPGPIYHGTLR